MVEVCMKSLKSIDPNNVTLCNLLHKTYLEAKCMYKVQDYNTVSIYIFITTQTGSASYFLDIIFCQTKNVL